MIDPKALFGILSSLFVLAGAFPYIKDIHAKKAHPHVLSWLGWGFITALGAGAMIAEGSTWAVAILLANTVSCLFIALYSIFTKVGVWSTTIYDYVFFGLGVLGLILWQTLHLPILALICAIAADLFFGLPTLVKTYKDPASETYFVWLTASISGLFGILAVNNFTFSESAYPIYLFVYDTILVLLVLRILPTLKKKVKE